MSGDGLIPEGDASSPLLSPRSIFFLVLLPHLLDHVLALVKKKAPGNSEQNQLRQEIKQLLREANSLSTPSTFAQAAKLRRQAAAKEKELNKCKCVGYLDQEGHHKEKNGLYSLFGRALLVAKVVLYIGLVWKFWGVPVVEVPHKLLQPLGRMLSTGAANPSTGLVPVGIIPWLVMTSQVSSLLCQKLYALLNLKRAISLAA